MLDVNYISIKLGGKNSVTSMFPNIKKGCLPAVSRAKEVIMVIMASTEKEWLKRHEKSSSN